MKKTTKNETGDNNITLQIGNEQSGNIKVATQIIDDLSSGIYSSPASCVKELVNNSFDANATKVTIRIKPVQDVITVLDDGDGMNAIDFDNNFAWISKSNKRNKGGLSSRLKRPLIGKIGIGFIAVNEICDRLEISSTKKGESIKFTAIIDFKEFQDKKAEAAEGGIIKAGYKLINEKEEKATHYTLIKLLGIKEGVRDLLDNKQYVATLNEKKNERIQNSFKNMKELLEHHGNKGLKAFSEDDAYIQFAINLASYIPVEYVEDGPVGSSKNKIVSDIVKMHEKFNFKVDLDGIYLKKPIFFPTNKKARTISFDKELETSAGKVRFKGYFYVQERLLVPRELNGVAIRIKNVPIAIRYGYDTSFLGYPNYMDQIFRNWVSGEVYVQEGLEEAMNIDRQSFRETHPHYMAIQNFLHKFLREEIFSKNALPIYEKGKAERDRVKSKDEKKSLENVVGTRQVKFKEVDNFQSKDVKPVSFAENNKTTTVTVDKSFFKKIKKKDWSYLKNVFLIFELARNESGGNTDKLQKLFYEKIKDWLEEK